MSPLRPFHVIVAATPRWGIGRDGKLPWKSLKGDMRHFREITSTTQSKSKVNAVVMGRKTWESIPMKYRPLHGRMNVVLTRQHASSSMMKAYPDDVKIADSLQSALQLLSSEKLHDIVESVYVIGGGILYEEALRSPLCTCVELTEVLEDIPCDTFIPDITKDDSYVLVAGGPDSELMEDDGVQYRFSTYERR